ncbi:hypothetical protein HY485_01135 [Candidatus Woesearchaeota archaeon]|nr:hypothetical protein [Candidatus Woesearchaeota archaeon]
MKKRGYFIAAGYLLLITGIVLLFEDPTITGASVIIPKSIGSSFLVGLMMLFVGAVLLVLEEDLEALLVGQVRGHNPVTGHTSVSKLYNKVTSENIDEVFQLSLEKHGYGEGIYGGKAVVYMDYEGAYHTIFLTETVDTHHRHAAATVARIVEKSIRKEHPKEFKDFHRKTGMLYGGDPNKSCELLEKCGGFELQYDKINGKIIGVQQDSWLTKEQRRCGRVLPKEVQEAMILELLGRIDQNYLSEDLKNLEEKVLSRLYS